jgi:hypothetical protein
MHDEPLPAGCVQLEERENSHFGQNISDSSGSLFNDQINNRVIRNILQVIRVSRTYPNILFSLITSYYKSISYDD